MITHELRKDCGRGSAAYSCPIDKDVPQMCYREIHAESNSEVRGLVLVYHLVDLAGEALPRGACSSVRWSPLLQRTVAWRVQSAMHISI